MNEEWRSVDGYESLYEVSSLGNVRSLPRRVRCAGDGTRVQGLQRISPWTDSLDGYTRVHLYDAVGKRKQKKVHHLVTSAFLGERPPGMLALHRDDVKSNNTLSNLYYGTHRENNRDTVANGNHKGHARPGDEHHGSKLRAADIPIILALKDQGVPLLRIAKRFGVTDMTIHDVVKGKTWTAQSGL